MRVIIRRGALRSTLRQGQWAFAAAAIVLLGYCGFVLADTWIFQSRENRLLAHILRDRQSGTASLTTAKSPLPAMFDGLIGRIDIPRLDISAIVIEGVGGRTLRRAVGHIPGTGLPGEPGNIGISGHRDTFFRPLRNIRRNDVITLTTLLGEYRYRVVSTTIVSPDNVSVLEPGASAVAPSRIEILTLVTCYPFYFVGSAPNRFIVRAERVI